MEKPVSMDAIAALSVNFGQNSERIIIGQKVAAIPAQPKITNQKMVLSGDKIEMVIARPSAHSSAAPVFIFLILKSQIVPIGALVCDLYSAPKGYPSLDFRRFRLWLRIIPNCIDIGLPADHKRVIMSSTFPRTIAGGGTFLNILLLEAVPRKIMITFHNDRIV